MIRYTTVLSRLAVDELRLGRLTFDQPHVRTFRAWTPYCDQNLHLNNAHYLTFMDYGRIAWFVRIGLLQQVVRDRIPLLLGGSTVTYRREIPHLAKFTLTTENAGFDDEWFYCQQTFRLMDGRVAARGLVRAAVRHDGERKPPRYLLDRAGIHIASAPLSDEILAWNQMTAHTIERIREG